jgi:hypothetical protein
MATHVVTLRAVQVEEIVMVKVFTKGFPMLVDDELIPDTNRFCTVSFSFAEKGVWYILALDWTSLSGLSTSLVYG